MNTHYKIDVSKKWFELIVNNGGRPDHPEDNTIIICASSLQDAIEKYNDLRVYGNLSSKCGEVLSGRQIYYTIYPIKSE